MLYIFNKTFFYQSKFQFRKSSSYFNFAVEKKNQKSNLAAIKTDTIS